MATAIHSKTVEHGSPWAYAQALTGGLGSRQACKSDFMEEFPTPSMPVIEDRFESCVPHSHDPEFDINLIARLVELMGVRARFSLTVALSQKFGVSPHDVEKAVRLMLRCLRLLHLCGYPREDIEVIVAHASCYLRDLMAVMRQDGLPEMGIGELAHVFCVAMYVAHSYTEDQNCPLQVWHKHLFMRYCEMETLNDAVMFFLARLDFTLRVSKRALRERLRMLQSECQKSPGPLRVSPDSPPSPTRPTQSC